MATYLICFYRCKPPGRVLQREIYPPRALYVQYSTRTIYYPGYGWDGVPWWR